MRVASFEVLDTLLTRRFAGAEDVFLALGRELRAAGLIVCEREEFARKRVDAERRARQNAPKGETTLAEIYAELARAFRWTPEQADAARDMELDLEEENLVVVPGALETVQARRNGTDGAIFLVETHLPSAFIERVLRREGFFEEGDKLFVSCELRLPKASGELFERIRSQYPGIQDWTHTGMDTLRDVTAPQRLGMSVIKRDQCKLTRFEQFARGEGKSLRLWRSRLAGAMRLARLECLQTEGPRATVWEIATDVSGLLVFGFVHWCLVEASERGVKRLCFVGPHGRFLSRVTARVAEAWRFPVEVRVLPSLDMCNEAAWRTAGLLDGVPFGVVELGWSAARLGTLALALHERSHGAANLAAGFFFGLNEAGPAVGHSQVVLAWWNAQSVRGHNLRLLEVLAGAEGDAATEPLAGLQRGIARFSEHWLAAVTAGSFEPEDFQHVARGLAGELQLLPTRGEARALGSFTRPGANGQFFLEMNLVQAFSALANARRRPVSWWREGSLALHPSWPLRGAVALNHFRRRWLG
ncbi:MAG: hypothetical protein HY300_03765 [Verrucomicrobia bacterium]|nr:hypothetical protein [Verrucomicrobiota bacterium]